MNFKLIESKDDDSKRIISNLMQIYTKELSLYQDETTNFKILDNGLYEISKYFDLYFKEDNRHPYILKCNDDVAGFALVRFNEDNHYEIGEFFVLDKYRKLGSGTYMAKEIFSKYHGDWEIRVLLKNKIAQEFWRKVVTDVSNGNYIEKLIRNNSRLGFFFNSTTGMCNY